MNTKTSEAAIKPLFRPAVDEFNRKGWSCSGNGHSIFGVTVEAAHASWLLDEKLFNNSK